MSRQLEEFAKRLEKAERRIADLENRPPVIDVQVPEPSASKVTVGETVKAERPQNRTTDARNTVPAELSPGTLHSSDFADHLGLKRTVFDSMMKNGVGGDELERTKIPILARPGQNRNYFTPAQQEKAVELLKRHGKL
jgi:hypothetical protein